MPPIVFAGKIYDGKFYILNDNNQNEVYDFQKKTWSSWPAIPQNTGDSACIVTWKDNFIFFGGNSYPTGVQIYNIPTQVMKSTKNAHTHFQSRIRSGQIEP